MSELYIDFNDDIEKSDDGIYNDRKYNYQSDSNSSKSNYSSNLQAYQNPSSSDNLFVQAHSSESNPRMSVQSITHQQFPEFSHFFICITRAFNLVGCSMKSLLLKIRVLPSLPIIETNTVWCLESEVNFRCGYALDFKNYAKTFNLGDYTPVVEFYRKVPNNKSNELELFAFSLLPLSVSEITECAGCPLTYLMKNQTISLHQFTTSQVVGFITVTIALGFPQQQQFIDPDKIEIPSVQKDDKLQIINQQDQKENKSENENEEESNNEESRRHKRHHRHHHRNKKKNSWIQKALAYGWKQPGYVGPDWKEKAKEKGWIPPDKTLRSSIGVTCTATECPNLKDIEIQQVAIDIDKLLRPQIDSSTTTATTSSNDKENDYQSDDSTLQLFNLMNGNLNNNNKKDDVKPFISDEIDSDLSNKPVLKATHVVTLFDKPQLDDILLISSDSDVDIINIQKNDLKSSSSSLNENNNKPNSASLSSDSSSSKANDSKLLKQPQTSSKANDSKILKQPQTSTKNEQITQQTKLPSNLNAVNSNQSINSIISDNISKIKKEIEDSDDDNSFDDDDLNLNATTLQILKELNIPIDKLKNEINSDLSQSSDSNIDSDLNANSHSSDDEKEFDINVPKQDHMPSLSESNSLLDSDSVTNSTLNSDSDSDSNTDNFLNLLGKKDPKFTNILNILNDK